MARAPVYLEVKDTFGNVVPNAVITIRRRSDNALVTLYQSDTGGTTTGNPMSADALGRAQAFIDRAAVNISVSGTGITPYTVPYDGAAASDRSIDANWQDQIGASATTILEAAYVSGDAGPRWHRQANGTMLWGPGTAGGQDTNLYRSAVSQLTTDGSITVGANGTIGGGLSVTGTGGLAVTNGDISSRGNFVPRSIAGYTKMRSGQATVGASTSVSFGHGDTSGPGIVLLTPAGVGMNGSTINYDIPNTTQIRVYNPQAFSITFTWVGYW